MSKAEELRKDFEAKLAQLQLFCPHEKTGICDYAWAPGHFCGRVKVCLECEKILEGPFI